ncbi:MAG: hypothetical protein GEV07_30510 [Streptosporangiales bacterium]|nr:hypothetical protein [Streptosporangiales bacterium]
MRKPRHDQRQDWDYDELVAELRAWAAGDYGIEAAVDLLAAHGHWLARRDFRDACLHATAEHLVTDFDLPQVWLGFDTAAAIADHGRVPASGSELQMLAVAVELAGYSTSRPLGDLLRGLDDANTGHVLDAIAHAAGRRVVVSP